MQLRGAGLAEVMEHQHADCSRERIACSVGDVGSAAVTASNTEPFSPMLAPATKRVPPQPGSEVRPMSP